jgi:glycosyltransferase involved in cell wall biosynthesis
MNILILSAFYPPYHAGGYELRCKEVVDGLIQRGHTIEILSNRINNHGEVYQEPGLLIFRYLHIDNYSEKYFIRLFNEYQDLRFIHKQINKYKPEVIYLWHTYTLTKSIYPYLAGTQIPIVFDDGGYGLSNAWENHETWYKFIELPSKAWYKNWIKHILSILLSKLSRGLFKVRWIWPIELTGFFNSYFSQQETNNRGVLLKNTRVIHSGISLEKFKFHFHQTLSQPVRIVVPGRIENDKGTKDAILLVRYLLKNNIDVRLMIIGLVSSEDYKIEIDDMIETNGLKGYISYFPQIEHEKMVEIYHQNEICYFPSYHKTGLSRVPLEAMACGCLVISYGNEGSNEVISNQETGYITSEGDYVSIIRIIKDLLVNPKIYQKIIIQAQNKIAEKHTMGAYIDKIERYLFESIRSSQD